MDDEIDVPTFATLFGCFRPIEHYRRARGGGGGEDENRADAGARLLTRIDAFLLHQLAAFWPREPVIVDLVADATGGGSAAFWTAHPAIRHVVVPPGPTACGGSQDAGWRESFTDVIEPAAAGRDDLTLSGTAIWDAAGHPEVARWVNGPWPVLYAVPAGPGCGSEGASIETVDVLGRLPPLAAGGAVFVLGLGRVGECGAVDDLVRMCRSGSAYRLSLARELSPFFASSGLGVLSAAADAAPHAALARVARAFTGNFEFLSLAQAIVEHAQRAPDPEPAAAPVVASGQGRRPGPGEYRNLVDRAREVVRTAVPTGSVVLVVSKGDDELLRLGRTRGRHFPQAADGAYAGHYPKDGEAAVEHLEALRTKGGQFLLLPATSLWWLEHYEAMRHHLETRYAVVVCRPDVCILFDLRTARRPGRQPARKVPGGGRRRAGPGTTNGLGARRAARATHNGREKS